MIFISFLFSSKDARLPVQLQRAMAAEAEAAREARAKVYITKNNKSRNPPIPRKNRVKLNNKKIINRGTLKFRKRIGPNG